MQGRLLYGWNADLDVLSALDRIASNRLARVTALLSVIDSSPDVARMISLIPLLERTGRAYTVVDRDVGVELPILLELFEEQFFTGFDEVWLVRGTPRRGKPNGLRITSDLRLTGPREGLSEWMVDSNCLAGLGDGDGLNFATFDERLAGVWRR